MKNGKAPTREQKKIMKAHGLVPENWLVVKNLPDSLEVVSRVSLKKVGGKGSYSSLMRQTSSSTSTHRRRWRYSVVSLTSRM